MKKMILMAILVLVLTSLTTSVFAHGTENFTQFEELIDSNIPCAQLSNEQLEGLGDYYMEQLHPGDAHTKMDKMMGGEGSDTLQQMHTNMAKAIYCKDHEAMSGMQTIMQDGMKKMMGGSGMMEGSEMMQSQGGIKKMMEGSGMMEGFGMIGMSLIWLVYSAIFAFVFGIIFWWTKKLIIKK